MGARLHDPIQLGGVALPNRLYRAPLLECAGNRPDASRILLRELLPSARSGVGLIFQGACIVTAAGGRTAPLLSRVHDRDFVLGLRPTVEAVRSEGAALFLQIGHGGLQCMELWHAAYRSAHPDLRTLAVSDPPWWFRILLWTRFLRAHAIHVMDEEEIVGLARAFGQAAGHAYAAGYDGIHLAGANGSIFQQFWSPVFNRRTDSFGGATIESRSAFFRLVVEEIRRNTHPRFPVTTKIPAEVAAPGFIRRRLTLDDGARIARQAHDAGAAGVAPVVVGVARDQSVARGHFPRIAWHDERFQRGYEAAFGGRTKARVVALANRVAARLLPPKAAWNAPFAARVKRAVPDLPVLLEGGIRSRRQIDRILADGTADLVGMARPFYAEPLLASRLLAHEDAEALCQSCNNCTIPQVTGAPGVCRTPAVLARRGELLKAGAYKR